MSDPVSRDPDILVIRTDRWKTFRVLLLTPIMLGASAFLAFWHPDILAQVFGWVGLVFFGACTVAGLVRFLRPDRLTLTSEGFVLRDWKQTQRVRWRDVKEVVVWTSHSTGMASWILHDKAWRVSLMARINSPLGIDGSIGTNWPDSPPKMRNLLSTWKNRYAPEPGPYQG